MRRLSADPTPSPFATLFSGLTGNLSDQLTSALPSQQTVAETYLAAAVTFWIIGGITLYLVVKAAKR